MTDVLTDPRTELVLANADKVDHLFCMNCTPYPQGGPPLCGAEDDDVIHPQDCEHPTCPMCEFVLHNHECVGGAR